MAVIEDRKEQVRKIGRGCSVGEDAQREQSHGNIIKYHFQPQGCHAFPGDGLFFLAVAHITADQSENIDTAERPEIQKIADLFLIGTFGDILEDTAHAQCMKHNDVQRRENTQKVNSGIPLPSDSLSSL